MSCDYIFGAPSMRSLRRFQLETIGFIRYYYAKLPPTVFAYIPRGTRAMLLVAVLIITLIPSSNDLEGT